MNADGTILYVANYSSNQILVCPVLANGALGNCQDSGLTGVTLNLPSALALTADGTTLYFSQLSNNELYQCEVIQSGVNAGFLGACSQMTVPSTTFNIPFFIQLVNN